MPAHPVTQRGFTLTELAITMVVIGILAAIAYPSYSRHVDEAHGTDGRTLLLNGAQQMQRCYTNAGSYEDCTLTEFSTEGHYRLSVESATAGAFRLEASPVEDGAQDSDRCGTYWINAMGQRGADDDNCW